jgi:hypothetical protein
MKKNVKNIIFTILLIIGILAIAYFALNKKAPVTDEEIVKCIGSKSVLYTQLGCHACKTQEEMFGENYQYLNIIDCWYSRQPCIDNNITATPTWIIKGERAVGVQTIDKLKELTGC